MDEMQGSQELNMKPGCFRRAYRLCLAEDMLFGAFLLHFNKLIITFDP